MLPLEVYGKGSGRKLQSEMHCNAAESCSKCYSPPKCCTHSLQCSVLLYNVLHAAAAAEGAMEI